MRPLRRLTQATVAATDRSRIGAARLETTAGASPSGTSVGTFEAPSTGNGQTTYHISNITTQIHNLG